MMIGTFKALFDAARPRLRTAPLNFGFDGSSHMATFELFESADVERCESVGPSAFVLRGFARPHADALVAAIRGRTKRQRSPCITEMSQCGEVWTGCAFMALCLSRTNRIQSSEVSALTSLFARLAD
jgi:hypothetical protein